MANRHRARIAEALANAFVCASEWSERSLLALGVISLGEKPRWLRTVVRASLRRFPERPQSTRDLRRVIARLEVLGAGLFTSPARVRQWIFPVPAMGEMRWPVQPLATEGELAQWLGLTPTELDWFADRRGLERVAPDEALLHYRYRWVEKRSGGVRLLEAPKPRTKALQRLVLEGTLSRIPPHEAAHGFRKGRDVRSHVEPHVGRQLVLKFDLEDFFSSISAARITAIFAAAGYPHDVARVLAEICTNRAPRSLEPPLSPFPSTNDVTLRARARQLAQSRHLPQGAPTSPALANLSAYSLDRRLSAAAKRIGARYTRYADDLVFSGDEAFARSASHFGALVAGIALDEGFVLNVRKTRLMTRADRQLVTGLVVNERPTIARADYERLEATLFNCARTGPAAQNREGHADFRAHLQGRIGWVARVDPARAAWLQELFARITWPAVSDSAPPR